MAEHGESTLRQPRTLFSEPWDPIVVRRGDALGLRVVADQLAQAVAPDLSNRVRDGRWVTILAWCLARSHAVFHASGGRSVVTRKQERARYAWLRPAELMWVARTIALDEDDWRKRTLAGQRSVQPWYQNGKDPKARFGMSTYQFRAYRQTGMYGAYRLAFRKWPGMTMSGDGWTPGPATNSLAKWLDGKLGAATPAWRLHVGSREDDGLSTRSAKLRLGDEDEHGWWLKEWEGYDRSSRNFEENTLPRRKNDFGVLPEVDLLKSVIFGTDLNGLRRSKVAHEVAKSSAADHLEVCKHLCRVFPNDATIALLPRFCRLADAGMEVMDLIAKALRRESHVPLGDLAAHPDAGPLCKELTAAAQEWRGLNEPSIGRVETVQRFVAAVPNPEPIACLRAMVAHHERHGGGLRWFVLRNGNVEPFSPPRVGSSRYRFRLWSLCRLATQCGVLRNMPRAILNDASVKDGESAEDADE